MSVAIQTDGEHAAWAKKWPGIGAGPHKCLWTREDPVTHHQRRLRAYWRLLQQLGPRPEWRCVELGSGRGTLSQYLADLGCTVTLVDLCQLALDMAAENFRTAKMPRPELVKEDCARTRLRRESFDLVHSVGLLEHFRDPLPVLKESRRLLRKGGVVWHLIVGGHSTDETGSGMFRSDRSAESYAQLASEADLSDVSCSPTMFRSILILLARRT